MWNVSGIRSSNSFFLPNYLNLNTASFFQDWEFDDGSAPPKIVVKDWLKLLKVHLKESPDTCVAVHCVAGLGRLVIMLLYVLNDFAVKKLLKILAYVSACNI